MKLAFLDIIDWDYDVGTPLTRPLGGSQSALCYLAVSLAARGHDVVIYTGLTEARLVQGVWCRSNRAIEPGALAEFDAVIVLNRPPEICLKLRPYLPSRCRLILWVQNAPNQPANAALKQKQVQDAWDRIVCVSNTHAEAMQREFALDTTRLTVMRNAIGPAFENLFADADELIKAKSGPPMLAYTSTPFRGLDVLLSVFPNLRTFDECLGLRVYSSLKVYYKDEASDKYAALYARCRSTSGVEYVGSLAQPLLANALRSAVILSYPNTFVETSCIAVMEAMAAGLLVVTTDLGALPETTLGMGVLTPWAAFPNEVPAFARAYTARVLHSLQEMRQQPRDFWRARWEQVQAVTRHCTWAARAREWEAMLKTMSSASAAV